MKTREIRVGNVKIGGGNPVIVQSMTNTDTLDTEKTLEQINDLAAAGCEIARCAVPNHEAVAAFGKIKDSSPIPLAADVHFDWRLAVGAIEKGADCVRINPGNIGGAENLKAVAEAAESNGAAIRIGVNSGSLEKDLLRSMGVSPRSLAESARRSASFLEDMGFYNFKVSVKASSVPATVEACRLFAAEGGAPLHIGVTEAGTTFSGLVKSSAGLGILLYEGIGDTLRISLTADPVTEVRAAWTLLSALGLRRRGPEVISCPTCGRTEIDLVTLAEKTENLLSESRSKITVAVMGCPVNGPGEAREADYGIAGGRGCGIIFAKGRVIKKAPESELLSEFEKILISDGVLPKK